MKLVLYYWLIGYAWVPLAVFAGTYLTLKARLGYPERVQRPLWWAMVLTTSGTFLTTLMMSVEELYTESPLSESVMLGIACAAVGVALFYVGERRAERYRHPRATDQW